MRGGIKGWSCDEESSIRNGVTFSSSNSRILWMEPPMAFFIKLILTGGRRSCATGSNGSQKLGARLTIRCGRRRDHILSFRGQLKDISFGVSSGHSVFFIRYFAFVYPGNCEDNKFYF